MADSALGFQPLGFAGGFVDRDTGLVHFGARDYDAGNGRWLRKDPLGLAAGPNTFTYCNGDPVNTIDVDGQWAQVVAGVFVVAYALGFGLSDPSESAQSIVIDMMIGYEIAGLLGPTLADAALEEEGLASLPAESNAARSAGAESVVEAESIECKAAVDGASPKISPGSVAGRTPQEIDALARNSGLTPKGPNPIAGKGAYVDPVTGEQRVLIHPDGPSPHAHVNDAAGNRLGPGGQVVPPESPDAHLPITMEP